MSRFDLIVIGAGPGGYEIAAEEAAKGRRVAIVERDSLGGTCLNRGCIPTKCLCASADTIHTVKNAAVFGVEASVAGFSYPAAAARMHEVVDGLRQGVETLLSGCTVIRGEARLLGSGKVAVGGDTYSAEKILIATGSRPAMLPVDGAEKALSSDDVLALDSLPASAVIIGAGVIGMEFASILNAFGVEVTVIEYCKEILPPFDREVAKRLRSMLSRRGIKIIVGAAVKTIGSDGRSVTYAGKRGDECVEAESVIMAVGRRPVLPDGLDAAGVELTERGFIKVDTRMRTTAPGIYAVGDCNGLCMLAHAAAAQARVALAGDGEAVPDLDVMPSAVFTTPELAMVGLTEEQCEARGIEFDTRKSLYAANGKARAMGATDGFVKVLTDRSPERRILGVHIIGAHASDLCAEAAAIMATDPSATRAKARIIHGHPTLSEVLAAAL